MPRLFSNLGTYLYDGTESKSKGHESGVAAVQAALAVGGQFLEYEEVDPAPESRIEEDGSLDLTYSHPLLEREVMEFAELRNFPPTAQFHFVADARLVSLTQGGVANEVENLNALAKGQLNLALLLWSQLRPQYGWIDESGDNVPNEKDIPQARLSKIFWANCFGPACVKRFGRSLFMDAPGWKKQELEDGSVLYVVTERYLDWWREHPKDVSDYFKGRIPGVTLYRAENRDY